MQEIPGGPSTAAGCRFRSSVCKSSLVVQEKVTNNVNGERAEREKGGSPWSTIRYPRCLRLCSTQARYRQLRSLPSEGELQHQRSQRPKYGCDPTVYLLCRTLSRSNVLTRDQMPAFRFLPLLLFVSQLRAQRFYDICRHSSKRPVYRESRSSCPTMTATPNLAHAHA